MKGYDDAEYHEKPEVFPQYNQRWYNPEYVRFHLEMHKEVITWLKLKPGDTLLDAGCGPGFHSVDFARRGLRVEGVELRPERVAEANQHAEAAGVADNLRFTQGDLTQLDYPDASFQSIFC